MAQAFDFSSFYGSQHLSDVTLVLKLAADEAAAEAPPAKKARSTRSKAGTASDANAGEELPGHGVVLAGSSSYFATELERWVDREGPSRPRIVMRVTNDAELHALRLLIQWVYTRSLPDDTSQQQLLIMLQLADRFSIPACAAACGDALEEQELAWATVEQLLLLPPFYHDNELFVDLMANAREELYNKLGDLEVAWASSTLRSALLQLPLKGIEMLLDGAETRVRCENTMLVVLSAWLSQHSVAAEDQARLAKLLVVPAFTPFFAASVAMQTPWLVEALGIGKLAAGMAVACVAAGEYSYKAACGEGALGLPAAWRDGPRPSSSCKELRLEWQVKLSDLEAVFRSGTTLDSHTQSFAGLEFCVRIVRDTPKRGQQLQVSSSEEVDEEEEEAVDYDDDDDDEDEDEEDEDEEEEGVLVATSDMEGSSAGGDERDEQEEGGEASSSGQGDTRWVLSAHVLARLPEYTQLPSGCRLLMALPLARLRFFRPDGRREKAIVHVCKHDQPPVDAAEGWRCEDCWQMGRRSDWRPDGYADHLRIILTVPTVL